MQNFDLILRGGWIIDPSQELNCPADIGISNGKILKIEKELCFDQTKEIINVSNSILTPGLIDLHTHVYWGAHHLELMQMIIVEKAP